METNNFKEKPKRNCPKCGIEISYKDKGARNEAERKSRTCLKCCHELKNHRRHTEEHKKKMSERMSGTGNPMCGYKFSESQKLKMSYDRSGEKNGMCGKKHTEEAKKKQADASRGRIKSPEEIKKLIDANKNRLVAPNQGKIFSEEWRKNMSASRMGRIPHNNGKAWTEEHKRKLSLSLKGKMAGEKHPMYGKHHTIEAKIKIMEAQKKYIGIKYACPNKSEVVCKSIIDDVLPGEYRFVGDRTLFVNGLNPDFVHNTLKIAIELFGEYHHDPKICPWKIRERQTEDGRHKAFKEWDWRVLIIWSKELKNISQLKEKILQFHNLSLNPLETDVKQTIT